MRKLILILMLLSVGSVFGLNIYESGEMDLSFDISKTMTFEDTGTLLELEFLVYRDFDNSHIVERDIRITDSQGNIFNPIIKKDNLGNEFAYFKLEGEIDTDLVYLASYNIKTKSSLYVEDENLGYNITRFTNGTKLILPNTDNIEELSSTINENTFYNTLFEIDNWLQENITYEIRPTFVSGDVYNSEEMYDNRRGFCVEYSNLAAAVLRNKGIPTRIVVGIVSTSESWGQHAWLEVQKPSGDWIEFDPTYHEIGYLNATHIRQGVFEDYSEVKDTVKSNFSLDNYNVTINYNPLDVDVKVNDSKGIESDLELSFKEDLISNESFNICLKNNSEQSLIFPVRFYLHSDFHPNEIKDLVYLKDELCYNVNTPEIQNSARYGYSFLFLDKNYDGMLNVDSGLPNLTVTRATPLVSNNKLEINFNIVSDKATTVEIGDENFKEFEIEEGYNSVAYETDYNGDEQVNIKVLNNGNEIQNTTINVDPSDYKFQYRTLVYVAIGLILIVGLFTLFLKLLLKFSR